METEELKSIMAWIKTTDLTEVCFREGKKGFSFAADGAGPAPRLTPPPSGTAPFLSGRRQALVPAPGIGIFQWGEPGRPRSVHEGAAVAAGDVLGRVEAGLGHSHEVSAPCAGRLSRVLVDAGKGVEYGQPLFVIEADV